MNNVTPLRPGLNSNDRAYAAMKTLATTLEELDTITHEDPNTLLFFMMELDKADTQITLLRSRLCAKRSVVDLTDVMGRTLP